MTEKCTLVFLYINLYGGRHIGNTVFVIDRTAWEKTGPKPVPIFEGPEKGYILLGIKLFWADLEVLCHLQKHV